MQAILVSDEKYAQLKHLADETGQTIEEMIGDIIPRLVKIPNKETQEALAEKQEDMESFDTLDDLYKSWDKL